MRSTRCSMHRENRRRECESAADILPMPIVIGDGTATAAASYVVDSTKTFVTVRRSCHRQTTGYVASKRRWKQFARYRLVQLLRRQQICCLTLMNYRTATYRV